MGNQKDFHNVDVLYVRNGKRLGLNVKNVMYDYVLPHVLKYTTSRKSIRIHITILIVFNIVYVLTF